MNNNSKIIVIGGNAAGPAAAAKAKRVSPDSDVILFEAGEYISTGTCELPYVLSGEIKDYNEIVFFTADQFHAKKGVKVYTKHRVDIVDRKAKSISVTDLKNSQTYSFNYDKLILATGSRARKHPALIKNYKNVFNLKTVTDLIKIKDYISATGTTDVSIIGAGFIGLETAEALINIGVNVNLFDSQELPFYGLSDTSRYLVKSIIENNNVNFYGNAGNLKFGEQENKIKYIRFDGRDIATCMVINAIGVQANIDLAIASGLSITTNNTIKTDSRLKTSDPNIFACGDNTDITEFITKKSMYVPLATYAHRMGHIAGSNSAEKNLVMNPIVKNVAVKVFENAVVNVGLSVEQAKENKFNPVVVNSISRDIIKVMPESRKIFGELIFDKSTKLILGATFIGGKESIGSGDLIASLIKTKQPVNILEELDYNYTPPFSPFINILSVLGRKAMEMI